MSATKVAVARLVEPKMGYETIFLSTTDTFGWKETEGNYKSISTDYYQQFVIEIKQSENEFNALQYCSYYCICRQLYSKGKVKKKINRIRLRLFTIVFMVSWKNGRVNSKFI